MLYAEYKGEETWASEFPNELANINTCADGLEHYPRCPECGSRVTHRKESTDGRAAHFAHCNFSGGGGGGGGGHGGNCPGSTVGESQEHKAMKSIAASALEFALDDIGVKESYLETELDAPHSDADSRVADCLLEFDGRDEQLGEGLIVEIQYGNKEKDKTAVMLDYLLLEEDYSVLWLWENDFHTDANLPQNWNCKVVHEQTVRDRVREQVWPVGEDAAVWSDEYASYDNRFPDDLAGLSSSTSAATGVTRTDKMLIQRVADTSTVSGAPARFAGSMIDHFAQEIKNEVSWESLFDQPETDGYIDEVKDAFDLPSPVVPVKLPEHLVTSVLITMRHTGRADTPERPPNPFDDIQCWNCGTYWWAKGEQFHHYCPDCGESVDIKWNLKTGRISEAPGYIDPDALERGVGE